MWLGRQYISTHICYRIVVLKLEYLFTFYIIVSHWNPMGFWNNSRREARHSLSYAIYIMSILLMTCGYKEPGYLQAYCWHSFHTIFNYPCGWVRITNLENMRILELIYSISWLLTSWLFASPIEDFNIKCCNNGMYLTIKMKVMSL